MSGHRRENGIVILLVAVVLLFVVGAMAALAIDVVTLYTARSEAQLAADGAALAGARVLANSGMTSTAAGPIGAEDLARQIATQVAAQNEVGGRNLKPGLAAGEVTVTFPNDGDATFATNPRVTVRTQRTDLPTFFARIWGNSALTVAATATAEAYNPSGMDALGKAVIPVAPTCVKPWLLPNISPNNTALPIFDVSTGAIADSDLVGWNSDSSGGPKLSASALPSPSAWQYYPGDTVTSFPPPTASSVACPGSAGFDPYQLSVAGCVQRPIACNSTLAIDLTPYPNRNPKTALAVNCLAHSAGSQGDSIDPASVPPQPFQFLAGADNPVVQAGALSAGTDILVSDSLVTVPVIDTSTGVTSPAQVIGFVQLFLSPDGEATPGSGQVETTVINLAGCGTGPTGPPILGNGTSPVPVRLVSPQ